MTEGEPDGAEYDKHVELLGVRKGDAKASAGDEKRGGEYSYS